MLCTSKAEICIHAAGSYLFKQCITALWLSFRDCKLFLVKWSTRKRVKCVSILNTSGQRKRSREAIRIMITAIQNPHPKEIITNEIKIQLSIIFCHVRDHCSWIGSWQNSCLTRALSLPKEEEPFRFKNENSYEQCSGKMGNMTMSHVMSKSLMRRVWISRGTRSWTL